MNTNTTAGEIERDTERETGTDSSRHYLPRAKVPRRTNISTLKSNRYLASYHIFNRSPMLSRTWILSDCLSRTHSQCLKATLYSYFNVQRPLTSHVPPGYHLIYFNPKSEEDALSKDGYDAHQQPDDTSFKRRMWIGGSMKFHHSVPFDQKSICVESIDAFRKLRDKHYVTINREIISGEDVAIEEKRTLIYTNTYYTPPEPVFVEKKPSFSHIMKPTELMLFRYSALTFNSHKIHYDKVYAESEGYPNVLLQGPLSVTLLLEWVNTLYDGLKIKELTYKNIAPIFAGDEIKLCLRENENSVFDAWIQKTDGQLLVEATLDAE